MRIRFLFGVIALLFTWSASLAVSIAESIGHESLRGLQGVMVVVEKIQPEAERDGLTKSQLQVGVELELRKSGIKVLTKEERLSTPGGPYLYVNVNLRKSSVGVYGISIKVELYQELILSRDPSIITLAATWHTGYAGIVGVMNLRNVYDVTKDLIDIFINDYLSVNPK